MAISHSGESLVGGLEAGLGIIFVNKKNQHCPGRKAIWNLKTRQPDLTENTLENIVNTRRVIGDRVFLEQ